MKRELRELNSLVAGRQVDLEAAASSLESLEREIAGLEEALERLRAEALEREQLMEQLRKQEEHLRFMAQHDALTGLVNRREFERRLEEALEATRGGARHVLCYLDLDRFKAVNDECGHTAGDSMLREVAGLIVRMVDRKRNTLVYMVYSDRIIEGSPQNSVTAIPILPWAKAAN